MGYQKERKLPDPKLPNKNLPPPTLKDFGALDFFVRYKDEEHPDWDDVVFLKGVGNPNANIMFIAPSPFPEDVDLSSCDPSLMRHPSTLMFKRICLDHGINLEDEYFTTVCKYALPKSYKGKPKNVDIKYCEALLQEEIKAVNPAIIVCVGRDAADCILNLRLPISKLEESYMFSEKYNARVFIMESISRSYYKPEHLEKLKREINLLNHYYTSLADGKDIYTVKQDYKCISTKSELTEWLDQMRSLNKVLFAVDCEWWGQTYFDGTLRSIQFAWEEGKAVYLNFTDVERKWVFDCSPDIVKFELQQFFNNPKIKYIGHNFNADALWMKNHLGLDVYEKCIMDTLYAFQTFDEYSDLKLEKLAAKYTDLGRYDIDLIIWKHRNKGVKFDEELGYGQVPLEILFPYGCKDADATFRLYKVCMDRLIKDDTLEYYMDFRLPFVTDGFTDMSEIGIPFESADGNKMRISYLVCKHILFRIFMDNLKKEAYTLLIKQLLESYSDCLEEKQFNELMSFIENDYNSFKDNYVYDTDGNFMADMDEDVSEEEYIEDKSSSSSNKKDKCKKTKADASMLAGEWIKPIAKLLQKNKSKFYETVDFLEHYFLCSRGLFNYASSQQKTKWLFTIKKLTPLTTTKVDGVVLDWKKVVEKHKEKEYTPSVDKATIKRYADDGDDLLLTIFQLNAVTTMVKTFLKGNEGGLQKFLCSDGKLRPSYLTTESNRPKSFKPNILNIPKEVSDAIVGGFKRVYKFLNINYHDDEERKDNVIIEADNYNKELFESLVAQVRKVYNIEEDIDVDYLKYRSLRWCFKAPPGWAFVDADYVSAEVYAIAYLANDRYVMGVLTNPDEQFAYIKEGDKEKMVRVAYIDEISEFTQATKDKYPCFCAPDDPRLVRKPDGTIKHPKRDIYWELVEGRYYMDTPREELEKRFNGKGRAVYRGSGKIANFCSEEDNFVLTRDNGYIKAANVKKGDFLEGLYGDTEVLNTNMLLKEPCREITFNSGLKAVYHDLHRLRCWNGKELTWVYAKDLTPDHQIVTVRNKTCNTKYNPCLVDLSEYSLKSSKNIISFDRNSKEFAYLAGLYVGDGNISTNKRRYKSLFGIKSSYLRQCVSKECVDKVVDLISALGFVDYKISYPKQSDKVCNITYGGSCFARYLYLNFGGPNNKTIPDFVFSEWDVTALRYFLAGLIDSDGGLSNGGTYWNFHNTNISVITNTALLCNYLGFKTRVRSVNPGITSKGMRRFVKKDGTPYKTCYTLSVYNYGEVELPVLMKSKISTSVTKESHVGWRINKDYKSVYKFIKQRCPPNNKIVKNLCSNIRDGYTGFTEFSLKEVEKFTDELPLKSVWYPSKIVSSIPCTRNVVAIECSTHEYIDTGMNSHNSIAYGGGANSLAKKIEIATGMPTPPEVGQKIMESFANMRKGCWAFKEYCESLPEKQGYYRSPSGFKRHFVLPSRHSGMSKEDKEYQSVLSSLKREACNIGMQSLVADSLARATPRLNKEFRNTGMQARVVVPLYDALYVLCPIPEIEKVRMLIQRFMADENYWDLPGGRLTYSLDFETTKRWASEPTEEEKQELSIIK